MRDGKELSWTWQRYFDDAMAYAKSITKVGVSERAGVAIMGSNTPEWVLSCMADIMNNCIVTGIYTTNSPDACSYQINHAEVEIVFCDKADHLRRVMANID